MTTKQLIEIQFFLKEILRKIKAGPGKYTISKPIYIFDSEEKESFLIQIIADLEKEIKKEKNDDKTK